MLSPNRKLVFAIAATLMLTGSAFAQSVFPPKLSVEAAVEKALDRDPRTRIVETAVKIAGLAVDEARTGLRPTVQFSQNAVFSNNPVFVFGSRLEQGRFRTSDFALRSLNRPSGLLNLRTALNFQQPIFDQRQTRSRVKRAEVEQTRAELQAESLRQKLRFDIVRDYFTVVLAKEMLNVSAEAVRSAEANSKKAKDMAEVGMTTDADFLSAEVETANARQLRLEAESDVVTAVAALNIALGETPEREFELTNDIRERLFDVDPRADLLRAAFENRPDLKRSKLAVETARTGTRAVRDQRLPSVGAFGSFGYSSPYVVNGSTDYTVGISLTYTLFDAGRKSRIEQAATAEVIAQSESEALADQIRLEVIRAEQEFTTSRARIRVSVKAIEQATEALRIVQDRYKYGLTTFNEVIRAEAALVRARHNLLVARYQYCVAYASVLLVTGRMTADRIGEF